MVGKEGEKTKERGGGRKNKIKEKGRKIYEEKSDGEKGGKVSKKKARKQ